MNPIATKPRSIEPVAASEAFSGNGNGRAFVPERDVVNDLPVPHRWPSITVIVLGVFALIGGITSFAGWAADLPRLTDWFGNGISIQPNAAIAVAAAGGAILFLHFGYRRTSAFLGIFVGLIGVTSVFQIATEIDLGINSLLMFDREWGRVGVIVPGRMGTPGAISWTLIGTALVFVSLSLRNPHPLPQVVLTDQTGRQLRAGTVTLSLIALGVSSLSLIGYLYGAEVLYTLPRLTVIALQTATFVFAVSLAIVIGVTDVGPMRLMIDPGIAGTIVRRTVPALILICLILGFLRVVGESAGLYDREFGTSARTLIEISLLLGLLWWTASAISGQSRRVREHESTLRQTEERFAKFMENLPGLAWIKDRDGRYVFVNESAEKAFGMRREVLYGKTDRELFPPETADVFHKNDREALEGKAATQTVEVLKDAAGVTRHSIVNKFPIPVAGDAPMVGGIAIDITEQKQMLESQEFLFTIAEKIRNAKKPDDLLADISRAVGEYLGVHRCLFNEIDLENDIETVHRDYARTGGSVSGSHKVSAYSPITSKEMMAGHTVVNRDSENDPRTADQFETAYRPNHELSYIAVPMLRGGEWVASLWCSDDRVRDWTYREVALLENVAERAWAAVERIRSDEYRAKLAAIVEYSDDAIVSKDLNGIITSWNRGAERLFGYAPREVVGQSITILIPPERFDEEPAIIGRIRRGESIDHYETVRRRKDGTLVDISLTVSPIRDPHGQIIGASKVARDITDHRRAITALRESEIRYRTLFDLAPIAVYATDADGTILEFNQRSVELWGREPREKYCGSFRIFYPDGRPMAHEDCPMARVLRGETVERDDLEILVERSDGERRNVIANPVPVRNEQGEIVGAINCLYDVTESRVAEAALRESEARSQLAQKAGNVGIWDWDAASGKTYWSDTMWAFYGEKPKKVNPDRNYWAARLHTEDRKRVVSEVDRIVASNETEYHDEFRIVQKSGGTRWIEVIATVARNENGAATRMYGVNLDITDKKMVAGRIRASETQLRLITNAIPALVSYCDVKERYRFANERYTEWFGMPREKIVGQRVREVVGARAYDHIKPYIDEVLNGNAASFDGWVNYKVAGRRFVHVSYVPDFDPNRKVRGFFALVSDLSALRHSEELLRSSQERMRLLTESFTDYAIISTDADGRIESWNPGAANIFGYKENEILGEPSDVLFVPEDVGKGVPSSEMRDARRNGRALSERWYLKKDGSRFFASGVIAPLHVGGGLTGYAKIAFDLTERKQNAEALQRAHDEMEMRVLERTRELAEANAALTDEINIRKTAERERIQLLQRLVTTQEDERRRIARDLHDQLGQRMTALRLKIASLKDVADGNSQIGPRVTRLQEIAEGLDSEISFLAWELRPRALSELGLIDATGTFVREWSRHYDIPAEFHATQMANLRLDVDADVHLYRIAQEALNNVAKHAKAKHVSVLFECTDDVIVLIVEDDGIGFNETAESKEKKGGRGLGLAGMKERSALIGGTLEVETAPGSGTTIYVKVPLKGPGKK